jgi:hypothetical protein
VQDGIRLLELSKKAYFLYKQEDSSEKRKLLNFVCSNSILKDHTLTATVRQPLIYLQLRIQLLDRLVAWLRGVAALRKAIALNSARSP